MVQKYCRVLLRGSVLITICVFTHVLSNLTVGEGDWRGVEFMSRVSPGSLPGKAKTIPVLSGAPYHLLKFFWWCHSSLQLVRETGEG